MLELIVASVFGVAPIQVSSEAISFNSIFIQEKASDETKKVCKFLTNQPCETSVKLICNVKTDFELNIKSFDRCETPFTPVSGYFYLDGSYEIVLPDGTIYKGTRK